MTLSYYADRVNLVQALRRFPMLDQPVALQHALLGNSRAPKRAPGRLDPLVEETILAIRDQPPEGLRRTPEPKAIQYYLLRDETRQTFDLAQSCSTRTI